MIIIVHLKDKSKKFKLIWKDFNKKWINLMITLLLIVIRNLNFKIRILIFKANLLKNLRKWKDKLLNFKSILIKLDKKRLNLWMKLYNVKDKFFYGKENINFKKICKKHLIQMLDNQKFNNWRNNFIEWNLNTIHW